jgi:hypothetical protein
VSPVEHRLQVELRAGLLGRASGALIMLLWLSVIVPPLINGTIYPAGLAHFTTMFVQAFDLALFLPPAFVAGVAYWRGRPHGELLAPVYCVFLSIQMPALLAKVAWMTAVGASAGPALVLIPLLLVGAVVAATLALSPHRRRVQDKVNTSGGSVALPGHGYAT